MWNVHQLPRDKDDGSEAESTKLRAFLIWINSLYDLIADSIHLLFHIKYTSDHFLHLSINCLVYKMYESKKTQKTEELNNKEKQQIF